MKIGAKISLTRRNLRIVNGLTKDFDFIEVYYTSHHLKNYRESISYLRKISN
jgi:hypothetical protein